MVKFISFFVISIATAVMFGWFCDIEMLKSILPHWVTMKFTTALCFFCSGFVVYYIDLYFQKKVTVAFTFLPIFCLNIFLVMGAILIATLFNVKTGIENFFVKEDLTALLTSFPGRPSIGTIINFIIISLAGLLTLLQLKKIDIYLFFIGAIVLVIGFFAFIGYIINLPELYYYFEDKSSAMAFHTAILFMLLGVALLKIKGEDA